MGQPDFDRVWTEVGRGPSLGFGKTKPNLIYTQDDWNDYSVHLIEEKGKDAPKYEMYRASKSLAERAAWEFVEEHKEEIGGAWDLVTFNPPWVYGPVTHEAPSLESFGSTQSQWYNAVVKGAVKGDALTKAG